MIPSNDDGGMSLWIVHIDAEDPQHHSIIRWASEYVREMVMKNEALNGLNGLKQASCYKNPPRDIRPNGYYERW